MESLSSSPTLLYHLIGVRCVSSSHPSLYNLMCFGVRRVSSSSSSSSPCPSCLSMSGVSPRLHCLFRLRCPVSLSSSSLSLSSSGVLCVSSSSSSLSPLSPCLPVYDVSPRFHCLFRLLVYDASSRLRLLCLLVLLVIRRAACLLVLIVSLIPVYCVSSRFRLHCLFIFVFIVCSLSFLSSGVQRVSSCFLSPSSGVLCAFSPSSSLSPPCPSCLKVCGVSPRILCFLRLVVCGVSRLPTRTGTLFINLYDSRAIASTSLIFST